MSNRCVKEFKRRICRGYARLSLSIRLARNVIRWPTLSGDITPCAWKNCRRVTLATHSRAHAGNSSCVQAASSTGGERQFNVERIALDGNRLELHQRATVSGSQSFDFRYGREKQDERTTSPRRDCQDIEGKGRNKKKRRRRKERRVTTGKR